MIEIFNIEKLSEERIGYTLNVDCWKGINPISIFHPPHLSERSNESVEDALVINGTSGFSSKLMPFEEVIRKYTGTSAVVALNSATSAIHLALIIVGIKKNDEVLCSTFTFCASVNPIIYQNATPVFVECEKDYWNMSPEHLEKAIQHRIIKGKKPKAIIVVHILGMPAAIERICEIAEQYDIPIIEDAAEALGARYKGRSLGSFGVFGIFSFNTNKIITAFGGGALVSNNEGLIRKAKFLATQARDQAPHYQHSQVGYNYIMSNVTAGIGLNQMSILDKWVKKRRGNYNYYHQALSNVSGISFLSEPSAYYFSNRWLTTILVASKLSDGITKRTVVWLWKNRILKHVLFGNPCTYSQCLSSIHIMKIGFQKNYLNRGYVCLQALT